MVGGVMEDGDGGVMEDGDGWGDGRWWWVE